MPIQYQTFEYDKDFNVYLLSFAFLGQKEARP